MGIITWGPEGGAPQSDIPNKIAKYSCGAVRCIGFGFITGRDRPELIERTPHAALALVQNVTIGHRRTHIPMPEQLLDRPDVVPAFEQVSREASDEENGT